MLFGAVFSKIYRKHSFKNGCDLLIIMKTYQFNQEVNGLMVSFRLFVNSKDELATLDSDAFLADHGDHGMRVRGIRSDVKNTLFVERLTDDTELAVWSEDSYGSLDEGIGAVASHYLTHGKVPVFVDIMNGGPNPLQIYAVGYDGIAGLPQ